MQILASQKEFHKSKSVARAMPGRWLGEAFFNRADGFFPIKAASEIRPEQSVAAGKDDKPQLEVRQLFHQIDAIAVGTVVERRRKKRGLREPDGAFARGRNFKLIRHRRCDIFVGFQVHVITLPDRRYFFDDRPGVSGSFVLRFDTDQKRAGKIIAGFGIKPSVIVPIWLKGDSPETKVGYARAGPGRSRRW